MKTVTLYTEAEFSELWPEYKTNTVVIRKNFHRFGESFVVLPGWENGQIEAYFSNQAPRGTLAYFKQHVADMQGAIAHMEAHPEPEPQLIRGGIPLNEIRDREDDHGNPPPPPPAPPDQDFRKGKSK